MAWFGDGWQTGGRVRRSDDVEGRIVTQQEIRRWGEQAWELNSTALKSIRDTHEFPAGTPYTRRVDLFDKDPFYIFTLKRSSGTAYELIEPKQPWSWRKFLNALSDEQLQDVVGEGVADIVCMPIQEAYDHKRQCAKRKEGKPFPDNAEVPVWDFVVTSTGGKKTRIHPALTKNKFEISSWGSEYEKRGPKAGKGNSDGPGTFKRMLGNTYDQACPRKERGSQSGKADWWRGDTGSWESQRLESTHPEGPVEGYQDWRGHWCSVGASGWHPHVNRSSKDAWRGWDAWQPWEWRDWRDWRS